MNDFTKEELIDLNIIVSVWCAKHIDDKKTVKLSDKLQSMIDNYCDHEWHPGGNRPWLHCIKCKANFQHEDYLS